MQSFSIAFICFLLSALSPSANATAIYRKIEVPENELVGSVVAEMSSFLENRHISFSKKNFKLLTQKLSSSSALNHPEISWFSLNEKTGSLLVKRNLDREEICSTLDVCIICIQVFSKTELKIIELEIKIVDVNEHAPEFRTTFISLNVSEESSPGSAISLDDYLAIDKDEGNNSLITYSVKPSSQFGVNQYIDETGRPHLQLVVKKNLDYEARSYFPLTLIGSDRGHPSRRKSVPLYIFITDENDNSPVFQDKEYEVAVFENVKPRLVIAHARADDKDSGLYGSITYFISGSNIDMTSTVFSINNRTGEVSLIGQLDREIFDRYIIYLEARDGGKPPRVGRARLIVRVDDVNDNAPYVTISYIASSRGNTVYLPELTSMNSYVAYVSAKDSDIHVNGDVTISMTVYSFDELTRVRTVVRHEMFKLSDGIIKVIAPLDAEMEDRYKVVLNATDRGKPPLWSSMEMNVIVLDENDHPPKFESSLYNISLAENTAVGKTILKVHAFDMDSRNPYALQMINREKIVKSKNGNVNYSLADAFGTFSISPTTGVITLVAPLDREQAEKRKITVTATDEGYPKSFSTSCNVIINVLDVNDNAPIFTNPAKDGVTLYATIVKNVPITRIQAVDYDAGRNRKLKYRLLNVSGMNHRNKSSLFLLDTFSGDLKLNMSNSKLSASLGTYEIIVEARDEGFFSKTSKRKFNVIVTNDVILPTPKPPVVQNEMMKTTTSLIIIIIPTTFVFLLILFASMGLFFKYTRIFKKQKDLQPENSSRIELEANLTNKTNQKVHKPRNLSLESANGKQLEEQKIPFYQQNDVKLKPNENLYKEDVLLRQQQVYLTGRDLIRVSSNYHSRQDKSFVKSQRLTHWDLIDDFSKRSDGDSGQGDCDHVSSGESASQSLVDQSFHQQVRRSNVDARSSSVTEKTHSKNFKAIPQNSQMKMFWSPEKREFFYIQTRCCRDPLAVRPQLKSQQNPPNAVNPIMRHFVPIGSITDSATTGYVTESELV